MLSCSACHGSDLVMHMRTGPGERNSDFAPNTKDFGRALADIERCQQCGHMQLTEMPSDIVLGEVYGEAADAEYVDEEVGQRATASRILARIEAHRPPGRLLDLGCWVGFLLAEAERRGWRGTGIEPSAWASSYATEKLGLDVRHAEILTANMPSAEFDVVIAGDVIEHLPAPEAALDRVAELLSPQGLLVLMLPDAGSRVARTLGARWWSVLPTHVQYFTRNSMTTLLQRKGWRVLEMSTAPKVFTVGYYLSRAGGYSPRLERAMVGAARRARISDRLWAPDFRDRMLVIAERLESPATR